MSGGGGPSNVNQTTTTSLPAWIQPYAKSFLSQVSNQVMPGGQLAQYNPALNQQVAGFTPQQQQAMGGLSAAAGGPVNQLGYSGANQLNQTLQGGYLNSNPYLDQMYGAASKGLVNQYQTAIAPSLMAQAQAGGVSGGSGQQQQQWLNQYGLGQNLGDLAANIYGGNYQQERARQLQAAQLLPTGQQGLLTGPQMQLGVGTLQQGQNQAQMNANTANAQAAAQYPYSILSFLGSALGQAGGGTGSLTAQGPNPSASKGLF